MSYYYYSYYSYYYYFYYCTVVMGAELLGAEL
jgi:hypothetical protein